ncbi:hypothetical protein FQR65_LT06511 [Abscondita terminalis]|nr:hypothetical protein FQR65_LT06511 [Abscondita terminalis]
MDPLFSINFLAHIVTLDAWPHEYLCRAPSLLKSIPVDNCSILNNMSATTGCLFYVFNETRLPATDIGSAVPYRKHVRQWSIMRYEIRPIAPTNVYKSEKLSQTGQKIDLNMCGVTEQDSTGLTTKVLKISLLIILRKQKGKKATIWVHI